MIELRPYQTDAIERLRHVLRSGVKNALLHAPTGSGKTVVACEILRSALAKNSPTLFLAHRKELIDQASAKLDECGIPHGVIMRSHPRENPSEKIQVASLQTLVRRQIPVFDLIVVDEAHRTRADSYRKILDASPGARVIGLTATPVRSDGKGLQDLFGGIVSVASVQSLTDSGWLVPARHFAPSLPDLSGVGTLGGDYREDQLEKVMNQEILVGNIIETWKKRGEDRQTIVFAVSVEHSKHLCREFTLAGVPAGHLDAETPLPERERILSDFRAGTIRVVSNCGILTEGYDNPSVSCVVLARPTKSLGLYLQMSGRSLRPFPGKTDTLILDHAGCGIAHGLVADDREWPLEGREKEKKDKAAMPSLTTCENCFAIYVMRDNPVCPVCGAGREIQPREIETETGELEELSAIRQEKRREEGRARTLEDLLEIARIRGYKPGWAYHRYRARGGR